MTSVASITVTKMLETLPEPLQDRALEHLRDYIENLREESQWDESFAKTQEKLAAAARQTRQAIAEGKSSLLDVV
jgi:hypothetical protein